MQQTGGVRVWMRLQLCCTLLSFVTPAALAQPVGAVSGDQTIHRADSPSLETQIALGRLHASQGDLPGAEKIFAALVAQHPESAEAHYNLGLAIVGLSGNKGGAVQAQEQLNLALQLRHKYPEADNVLGMLLFDSGDPDAALVHLRRAALEDDTSAEIHFHLGRVLSQRDDNDAEAEYHRAILLRPNYPEAQTALGELLLRTGRTSEARSNFEAALRENPDIEGAHYGMARVLQSSGNPGAAQFEFAEAKALIQRKSDAVMSTRLSNSALDLARQGHKEEAVAEARKAVLLAPDSGVAVFNLGLLLADTGDISGALHEVRKAASLLPMNQFVEATFLKLQQALQQTGSNAGTGAGDAEDRLGFAHKLAQKQDFLGASGQLLYQLRQQPDRADLCLELTSAWLQLQRWQEAELEARKVIYLSPKAWQSHLFLAEALLHEGKSQQAEAAVNDALRLSPENPDAIALLRQILAANSPTNRQ